MTVSRLMWIDFRRSARMAQVASAGVLTAKSERLASGKAPRGCGYWSVEACDGAADVGVPR